MTASTTSLLDRAALDRARVSKLLGRGLEGADDGELFLEYRQAEALVFDNGRLKQATYDTAQGFGLRAVKGEAVGYAHASDVSEEAIARAVETVRAVQGGYSGSYAQAPARTNVRLYGDENPLGAPSFEAKVKLLEEIDAFARAKDPRVRQVSVSFGASWQVVEILRADGETYRDVRPLVRVNVSVVAGEGDRQESGSHGYGGREGYQRFIETGAWKGAVDDAVRQALVNLEAVPAPAGEFDVVLGAGWPGVMLHEAVGHGLEGDFNRKKTSAFAGLMGQQVAAKGVTVVDDGTMTDRRGSLTIDDEGTYVFQCTEAYRLENGKVGAPIKGAMLIGNGPSDLHRVSMVGNDLELDTGIGTCGKNGQGVPVGVGQPTLRMDRITVGGTG
jgi:TldD protein